MHRFARFMDIEEVEALVLASEESALEEDILALPFVIPPPNGKIYHDRNRCVMLGRITGALGTLPSSSH